MTSVMPNTISNLGLTAAEANTGIIFGAAETYERFDPTQVRHNSQAAGTIENLGGR